MAECLRFVCGNCGESIDSWDEGNPYYLDKRGRKHYAYHPDDKRLARCIGNDSPRLCLNCGAQFVNDSRSPTNLCPKCGSADVSSTFRLDGKRCPVCKNGVFCVDPSFRCIS
jgi:DNA-directed RNA polymerase subunit RPC12/RpoP